jgi:hypothetical protein
MFAVPPQFHLQYASFHSRYHNVFNIKTRGQEVNFKGLIQLSALVASTRLFEFQNEITLSCDSPLLDIQLHYARMDYLPQYRDVISSTAEEPHTILFSYLAICPDTKPLTQYGPIQDFKISSSHALE